MRLTLAAPLERHLQLTRDTVANDPGDRRGCQQYLARRHPAAAGFLQQHLCHRTAEGFGHRRLHARAQVGRGKVEKAFDGVDR